MTKCNKDEIENAVCDRELKVHFSIIESEKILVDDGKNTPVIPEDNSLTKNNSVKSMAGSALLFIHNRLPS